MRAGNLGKVSGCLGGGAGRGGWGGGPRLSVTGSRGCCLAYLEGSQVGYVLDGGLSRPVRDRPECCASHRTQNGDGGWGGRISSKPAAGQRGLSPGDSGGHAFLMWIFSIPF